MEMITGVILAGGKNRRMGGREKALLELEGESILERTLRILRPLCAELLVVTNTASCYLDKTWALVGDIFPHKGPLGGIHSGLFYARYPHIFVVACDMPFLSEALIAHLLSKAKNHDIVVPVVDGKYQPLHAVYGKSCLPRIENLLAADELKITNFYHGHRICTLNEQIIAQYGKTQRFFTNINSQEDWQSLNKNGKGEE